jgi:hypothetical protein
MTSGNPAFARSDAQQLELAFPMDELSLNRKRRPHRKIEARSSALLRNGKMARRAYRITVHSDWHHAKRVRGGCFCNKKLIWSNISEVAQI